MPAKGDGSSTTKSAIDKGTVEIRSNPNQDITGLSRDPSNSLNTLGKIFDKKTVQEKQELANLFGELAYEQVHIMASNAKNAAQDELEVAKKKAGVTKEEIDRLQAKVDSWSQGGTNKIALHAFVGGIMANLGGSDAISGAFGAGLNEAVQGEISKRFRNSPEMQQWASALVGATAASVVGGNTKVGASTAASGTKNNKLNDYEIKQFRQEIITALAENADTEVLQEIIYRYKKLSIYQRSIADASANTSVTAFGSTLIEGYSRELDADTKEFLIDQLGFNWDEAFSTIKTYNKDATDADVWDNLYEHIKANEGAIAWKANQNIDYLKEVSGPVKGETILSLGKGTIIWERDGIGRSVIDNQGEYHDLEVPLSRGDYAYRILGIKPSKYYLNGVAAIYIDGDYYPAYSAPIKGDVLAEIPNAKFTKIDGQNYVVDENGKAWYTTKEPAQDVVIDTGKYMLGFGKGLKNKVDEIPEFMLKSNPKQIDAFIAKIPSQLQSAWDEGLENTVVNVSGKVYKVTLESWKKQYNEIQTISDPEERGMKTAELVADIGTTFAAVRSVGKAVISFSEFGATNVSKLPSAETKVASTIDKAGTELLEGSSKATYKELKQAAEFLNKNGLNPVQRREVIEAFNPGAEVVKLEQDLVVYRYYGGAADPRGRWVTTEILTDPINQLALPPGSTAENFTTWIIPKGTEVLKGTVAPNFGRTGRAVQIYLPDSGVLR